MSSSSSPDMNITIVFLSSFETAFRTSNKFTSYLALLCTSFFSFSNKQGKTQLTMQSGTTFGEYFIATYLHKLLKLLKVESATIISAFPQSKAVAAPMLLPHKITLYPSSLRKFTTDPTCSAYRYPRLIVQDSQFLPQPMKSKQAREMLSGMNLRREVPSILQEALP